MPGMMPGMMPMTPATDKDGATPGTQQQMMFD